MQTNQNQYVATVNLVREKVWQALDTHHFCNCHIQSQRVTKKLTSTLCFAGSAMSKGNYDLYVLVSALSTVLATITISSKLLHLPHLCCQFLIFLLFYCKISEKKSISTSHHLPLSLPNSINTLSLLCFIAKFYLFDQHSQKIWREPAHLRNSDS